MEFRPMRRIRQELPKEECEKILRTTIMTRKETIIAAILLIAFGTSMHFVHHVPFFNHFMGYIFPVTESVMAHMKMVFYPMLLLSLYLTISRHDIREIGAPVLGGVAVMPLIVLAFFSYWVFVRHELMMLDIVIYIACMIGAIHLAKRWRTSPFVQNNWRLWIVLILCGIVIIGSPEETRTWCTCRRPCPCHS